MKKCLIVASVLLALTAGKTEADGIRLLGTASRVYRTAPSILLRAGCHPLWLSKVLSDSGIPASQAIEPLPVGQRLILVTDARCEGRPPEAIAQRSQALLNPMKRAVPKVAKRAASKKVTPAPAPVPEPPAIEVEAEVSENQSAPPAPPPPPPPPPPGPEGRTWRVAWVVLLTLGVIAAVVIGTIWFLQPRRKYKSGAERTEVRSK